MDLWVENPYDQFSSGETVFQWKFLIHPTDLVYFRKRIGKPDVEKIFQVSISKINEVGYDLIRQKSQQGH